MLAYIGLCWRARVCVRVCACSCVRASVRACVCVCARACVRGWASRWRVWGAAQHTLGCTDGEQTVNSGHMYMAWCRNDASYTSVLSLSLTLCLKTVKPGLPQRQCSALRFTAGRWHSPGAAAVCLLPTERRLVADGLCCLTVRGLTRSYCRPVPALLLYLLGFGRFASTARARVCVRARVRVCAWMFLFSAFRSSLSFL